MATVIGLCLRVKLMCCFPPHFKGIFCRIEFHRRGRKLIIPIRWVFLMWMVTTTPFLLSSTKLIIKPYHRHIIMSAPNAKELVQKLEEYEPIHDGVHDFLWSECESQALSAGTRLKEGCHIPSSRKFVVVFMGSSFKNKVKKFFFRFIFICLFMLQTTLFCY
ncbi:uncharacterized protein LOC131257887 [Magnolia sinica]|uniref:uncharacterized protein LOC131257887 n=1 Tax=Magnolia sinica TaxID=86752 RepID=UPI00265AE55D|nr:uncharacterized protein LOC131257887 [Magnolia sinica]